MSSTPPTSSAGSRSSERPERNGPAGTPPPAEARAAFESALERLQRRPRGLDEEPGNEAATAQPQGPQQPALPWPAASAAAAPSADGAGMITASAGGGTQAASLDPQSLGQLLSALRVPASPDGVQRWEFQFASDSGLALQGLTLTGQPGSTLTVHLHANTNAPWREREISSQRLGELRQRLAERGAPVDGLHWADDDGSHRQQGQHR